MNTNIAKQNINETELEFPFKFSYQRGVSVAPSHWHREIEIIRIDKGEVSCEYNGNVVSLKKGDIFIAMSGDVHGFSYAENHWRLVILFDLDILNGGSHGRAHKKIIKHNLERIERFSMSWSSEAKEKMDFFIDRMREEYVAQKEDYHIAIKAILYQIVLVLMRDVPKREDIPRTFSHARQKRTLDTLQKVLTFVENNYTQKITLEDVAKHLNYERSYFAHFFKKSMGTTFFTYLNNFRLNKAQKLLLKDEMNITEISQHVGFNNVKTFNRIFKQYVGITPTEYKKNNI